MALWPGPELPRTEGTRKLKRRELKQWLADSWEPAKPDATGAGRRPATGRSVVSVLERFAPGRTIGAATTIDELGLSSLERVELMMALEETLQVTVDEAAFAAASTVADLEALTRPIDAGAPAAVTERAEPIAFPSWNRTAPVRALRRVSLPTWILPLARLFVSLTSRASSTSPTSAAR